jgi:alcohol dehydrogenase
MPVSTERWQLPAYGRHNLQRVNALLNEPGPGEVLVKVEAVALNYRDLLVLHDGMGMPAPLPLVPGSDMSGEVVAVGAGAAEFAPGDKVVSTFFTRWQDGAQPRGSVPLGVPGPGMLSQYVVLEETALVAAPRKLDAAQASTLTCAGATAWHALAEASATRPGDTVVVIGTGGVALFAVQIAKAHSARVIVVSGSDRKLERARALGADHGVNRLRTPQWQDAVRELTGGRGADHVLELAGCDNFAHTLAAAAQGGRISVIGNLQGDELRGNVYPVLQGRLTIQGIGVSHRRALQDLVRAVDWLELKPVIEREYGFDEVPAALDHLERGSFGKLVLRLG